MFEDEIEHVHEIKDEYVIVDEESTYIDNLICLAIVTGCAFIGGFLIMLTNGY